MTQNYNPQAFRAFEHEGWENVATSYPESFGNLTGQAIPFLFRAIDLQKNDILLDMACGHGLATAKASELGAKATGIDFSNNMISVAKEKYPQIDFQQGDVEDIHFQDGYFDKVVSNFGLLHFPNPEKALKELARVTKNDGRIALTTWDTFDHAVAFRIVSDAVAQYGEKNTSAPDGPDMFLYANKEFATQSLIQNGWTNIQFMEVPIIWQLANGHQLIENLLQGTVRMASKLRSQTPENLKRIEEAIDSALVPYKKDNQFFVPQGALLISATRMLS